MICFHAYEHIKKNRGRDFARHVVGNMINESVPNRHKIFHDWLASGFNLFLKAVCQTALKSIFKPSF